MGTRELLGPGDVSDDVLAEMVRDALDVAEVDLLSCEVAVVDYDLEALTTAGRYWVRGTAEHMGGLSMPRAHTVRDLDEESACLWLQVIDADPAPWPLMGDWPGRSCPPCAASSSGRTRWSPAPSPPSCGNACWLPRTHCPRSSRSSTTPRREAHGDACPRNLLVPRDGSADLVLIDFAFWCRAPLGFDLSQLLMGEVQQGERPAAERPELEEVCLAAYVRGLRAEGCEVPCAVVRRQHALLMLLFAGSAVPLEVLHGRPAPGAEAVVRERPAAASFILDLVDATGGVT